MICLKNGNVYLWNFRVYIIYRFALHLIQKNEQNHSKNSGRDR